MEIEEKMKKNGMKYFFLKNNGLDFQFKLFKKKGRNEI